jgi:hypothetical protein
MSELFKKLLFSIRIISENVSQILAIFTRINNLDFLFSLSGIIRTISIRNNTE